MPEIIHRALVVDDDFLVREATARALTYHSFWCDSAADGIEALAKAQANAYDLVVTDLRMPNKHGHSLIVDLLRTDAPPQIVVLTGIVHERIAEDLRGRGVTKIVHKPVDYQTFALDMMSLFVQNTGVDAVLSRDSIQGTALIREIEHSLEIFELCIPPEVDHVLSASYMTIEDPSPVVLEFMQRLWARHSMPEERRGARRIRLLSSAVGIPVSKDMKLLGEPQQLTFCDISGSGACLITKRNVTSQYIALKWRSAINPYLFLMLTMHIKRCRPVGPFYEVAGEFIMRD